MMSSLFSPVSEHSAFCAPSPHPELLEEFPNTVFASSLPLTESLSEASWTCVHKKSGFRPPSEFHPLCFLFILGQTIQ